MASNDSLLSSVAASLVSIPVPPARTNAVASTAPVQRAAAPKKIRNARPNSSGSGRSRIYNHCDIHGAKEDGTGCIRWVHLPGNGKGIYQPKGIKKGFAIAAKYIGITLFILAFAALIGIGGPKFIGGFMTNPFNFDKYTSGATESETPSLIPGVG